MVTLTRPEEKIMRIFWGIGKGFIKDIPEKSPGPGSTYNSVSTISTIVYLTRIIHENIALFGTSDRSVASYQMYDADPESSNPGYD